jgi:hypothetical protein
VKRAVIGPICLVIATLMACANSASLGTLPPEPDAGSPPSFTPTTDGGEEEASLPGRPELLCVQTECVSPYATCPTSNWRCDTNLDNDLNNCGGCGVTCPLNPASADTLKMEFSCAGGQCAAKCATVIDFGIVRKYADCNNSVDDGCEVVLNTKTNCSACGDVCPGATSCFNFQCGCPPNLVRQGDQCVCPQGTTECTTPWGGKECVDTTTSDTNCGTCGTACTTVSLPEPNLYKGCLGSTCDQDKCRPGYFDCDNDKSNGCESLVNTDAKNCGACGNACDPGQICFRGECQCKAGTFCTNVCVDLATDPMNCGRCGEECPGRKRSDMPFGNLKSPNGAPSCVGGRCDYTCDPGWADCDQDIDNGCEADILTNPFRCGGCDIKCDVAAGQVCIGGKCAMRECKEGEVR